MSSKINQVYATADTIALARRRTPVSESEQERRAFRVDAALIERLGASHLDPRKRKQYEAKRIVALGGKAPKSIKTPINILKGMRRKQKQRQDRQDQLDRAAGNLVLKRSGSTPPPSRPALGLRVGLGQYRQGKLQLSNRDIARVESAPVGPVRLAGLLKRKRK